MYNPSDIILDSISDGVFTVDRDWHVTSFNRAAEDITGIGRDDAIGQFCSYVFRASVCETGCPLRRTFETGEPVRNMPIFIITADGKKIPVSISTALLRDADGNIIGGVETFRDLTVEEELKRELRGANTFEDIISRNHRMKEIFSLLPAIAESQATVLVEGESGTGKELICRAVHNLSPRRNGPFVAVNCGALPDTLLESELFGHKAGAFTDARRDKKGQFAIANRGTILLDEIGDITPALQVRLLRLLQEKEYFPVGAEKPEKSNVRVVAATNRNLEKLVKNGVFREDLYYRINVVKLTLPPLRDRRDDIPLLVDHFVEHYANLQGKQVEGVSEAALAVLMIYDYPGNIRELQNAVEHAFVLCANGLIQPRHLPAHLRPDDSHTPVPSERTLKDVERDTLITTLRSHHYNRALTARELGIHKTTLYRKIREYGIELPDYDGRSTRKGSK